MKASGLNGLGSTVVSPPHHTPASDVSIVTAITPPSHASSNAAPSPTTVARKEMSLFERTRMLLAGQDETLANILPTSELIQLSNWRYQLWYFAFKTAKHWGRGPANWTWEILNFSSVPLYSQPASPNYPSSLFDIIDTGNVNSPTSRLAQSIGTSTLPQPSQLCRWSVHVDDDAIAYEGDFEDSSAIDEALPVVDLEDEGSWPEWRHDRTVAFEETLVQGIRHNTFRKDPESSIPVETKRIAEAADNSKLQMLQEALGFAIMGRNEPLVFDLVERLETAFGRDEKTHNFYPYHLAISYLDGSKSCCNIIRLLCDGHYRFGIESLTNQLGHTPLDALMIRILSSHTSILPGSVDDNLRQEKRFPGEEVDICGRWDADSDIYRALINAGQSNIPFSWKHKFCHTSVQAVVHTIMLCCCLLPNRFEASGLFIKWCFECGQKMVLSPLHLLVVVSYHLLQYGSSDEDLFGAIAVLLCLLQVGFHIRRKQNICPALLFGNEHGSLDTTSGCSHTHLTPLELHRSLPTFIVQQWPDSKSVAWHNLGDILQLAETSCALSEGIRFFDDEVHPHCKDCGARVNLKYLYGESITSISRAVQAELLTYRRLRVRDSWVSRNIRWRPCPEGDCIPPDLTVPAFFLHDGLEPPCDSCGNFILEHPDDGISLFPRASDVSANYFSNLGDVWKRMNPIRQPIIHF